MRISDWSSDVCSSDLAFDRGVEVCIGEDDGAVLAAQFKRNIAQTFRRGLHDGRAGPRFSGEGDGIDTRMFGQERAGRIRSEAVQIGRASRRERVCQYV